MASSVVVNNLTKNSIVLDAEPVRTTLTPLGSYTIAFKDFNGNYKLCTDLSAYVTNSRVTVLVDGTAITSANLLSYAQGADMLLERFDLDEDGVIDEVGSGGGSVTTELSATAVDLVDDTDFILEESELQTIIGMGVELEFDPTASTGQVTVELFQDSARTIRILEHIVDLTDTTTYNSYVSFGFNAEVTGKLYGTVSCSAVPVSQTVDLTLFAQALSQVEDAEPITEELGDGLQSVDETTSVKLATNSGLGFTSGGLSIDPDLTAAVYPSGGAGGASVTGAVALTTDQDVAGIKRFNSSGYVPRGASGAPATGTWTAGTQVMDSDNILWRCTTGGTPGTWELADTVTAETDVVSTASLGDGDSEIIELDVYGNVGQALWLRIWGKTTSGTADQQIQFRARIYETSTGNGRDLVWQGEGLMRQTSLTAILPASQTYLEVNTNDIIDNDEAVIVYEDDDRYELGRCSARPTGQISLDEALVDDSSWASGSLVLIPTEWFCVPWINTDGSPTNANKIFIEIRHDGVATDPDLTFYAQALAQSRGVIR